MGIRAGLGLLLALAMGCSSSHGSLDSRTVPDSGAPPDSGQTPQDAGPGADAGADGGLADAGDGGEGRTDAGPCPPDAQPQDAGGCLAPVSWTAATPLATDLARNHHVTFTAESDAGPGLYYMGGFGASGLFNDAYRAPIAADGSIGAWTTLAPLPAAVAGQGLAQIGSWIVLAGGLGEVAGGGYDATYVWIAQVLADGGLSSWATGPSLPQGRFHAGCAVSGNDIYVSGGLFDSNGGPNVSTATVWHARLAADGTLSDWDAQPSLAPPRSHHSTFVDRGGLYVVGGLNGDPDLNTGTNTPLADIQRAAIQSDGGLGPWVTVGQLPASIATQSNFVHDGALYLVGGIEGNDPAAIGQTTHVYWAPLGADGTVGAFQQLAGLPTPRGHVHQTPIWGATIYSIGGSNPLGQPMTDVDLGTFH